MKNTKNNIVITVYTVLIKEELVYINLLAERIYKYDKYETNKTK